MIPTIFDTDIFLEKDLLLIREALEALEEFTAADGITYVAVSKTRGCTGCAFCDEVDGCYESPLCSSTHRSDGKAIVWVKKEEKE